MNLAPPSSQKAADRPISFVLDDQAFGSPPVSIDLVIRPEDLSRTDPSRINVQQTLGGAWADNFGPGIANITISGHTGWRRTEIGYGDGGDGLQRFQQLYAGVYTVWHEKRRAAADAGIDPDRVQMIFADALNDFSGVVAITNFNLKRSRSRPLLAMYQINMLVLNRDIDQAAYFQYGKGGKGLGYLIRSGSGANAGLLEAAGLDSMSASVSEIVAQVRSVQASVDCTLLAPVQHFMFQTARLYGQVRGAIAEGNALAASLVSVAQMTARSGINLFRTLAAVASIPQQAKNQLMTIAGAYSNIFCVLRNALQQQIYYEDYAGLYGASNCSSTAGGRPASSLAGENPFYKVVPTMDPLPLVATAQADAGMKALLNSDPVLAPMPSGDMAAALSAIQAGFEVEAVT